ncbi:hypothetical protein LCGC14_1018150 [marine sediment metagenome]|uniref:Uncharacterized protein n=1 Tax=marine sediment metagenome TaxID=412755 RepID=A0A0F9R4B1_9ZZZZ
MTLQAELREAESKLYNMEKHGPDEDCPSMEVFGRMIQAKWQQVENLREALDADPGKHATD